jgi:hypothetical protein
MPTTTNMLLVLPTEDSDADTWDAILNTALTRVDAHDHTTSLGVKVPTAGININADLTFGGKAATNVQNVTLTPIAVGVMAAYANGLFVNSADGELYFRDGVGNNAKMTAGGVLNVASLAGGIGGDYVTAGALVAFVDSADRFTFQQQGGPRPWAGLASGNVDIYEQAPSIVNRVRLRSPAALAASYELVMPATLPAARALLQVDSAGVVSTQTDNELPSGQHIKLVGLGKLKRDDYGASFGLDLCRLVKGSGTVASTLGVAGSIVDPSVTAYFELPPVNFEETISSVTIRGSGAAATLTLMQYDPASGSAYAAVAGATGGFTAGACTLTPTTPVQAAGKVYVLRVVTTGAGTGTLIGGEYLRKVA